MLDLRTGRYHGLEPRTGELLEALTQAGAPALAARRLAARTGRGGGGRGGRAVRAVPSASPRAACSMCAPPPRGLSPAQADALPERWWDMNAATVRPSPQPVGPDGGGDPRRRSGRPTPRGGAPGHGRLRALRPRRPRRAHRREARHARRAPRPREGVRAHPRDPAPWPRPTPEAQIVASMPADAPNTSLRRALLAGAAGLVLDGTSTARWSPRDTPCSPASWPCPSASCARSRRARSPIARSRSSASWSSASPTVRSPTSSSSPRAP